MLGVGPDHMISVYPNGNTGHPARVVAPRTSLRLIMPRITGPFPPLLVRNLVPLGMRIVVAAPLAKSAPALSIDLPGVAERTLNLPPSIGREGQ